MFFAGDASTLNTSYPHNCSLYTLVPKGSYKSSGTAATVRHVLYLLGPLPEFFFVSYTRHMPKKIALVARARRLLSLPST
jgi:hypothetical protein